MKLAGRWIAIVNGQEVALTLSEDGCAEVLGNQATWRLGGSAIVLETFEGQVAGVVRDGQLVFVLAGQLWVFSKKAGPARPAAGVAKKALAGRWLGEMDGREVTLALHADGSAELLGEPAVWQGDGATVVVAGPRGRWAGVVQDGQLLFDLGGRRLSFSRATIEVAQPGVAAPPLPPFQPQHEVAGRTVQPEGTRLTFTVPEGWAGHWTQLGGLQVYAVTPPGPGKVVIGVTARVLGRERSLPMTELLSRAAAALWGAAAAAGPPIVREVFSVKGRPAGRIVHRGPAPGPAGQPVEAEAYVGLVVMEDWALVLTGLYDASRARALRAGLDTMLSTLDGRPPARNHALEDEVVGCWEAVDAARGPAEGERSTTLRFHPGGHYERRSSTALAGVEAAGQPAERGRYMIHDELLTLVPDGGDSYTSSVALAGGSLTCGETLYVRCRPGEAAGVWKE